MLPGFLVLLTALLSSLAAWRWRGSWRDISRADSIVSAAAVPALFSILALAAWSVVQMLSDPWGPLRLAPAAAMTRGYALYYPQGEGPVIGWIYGPVMPLLQLPAALLPTPVAATVAAGILHEAVVLFPLLLLAWTVLPATLPGRATGVLILAALQACLLHLAPSTYWLQQLVSDSYAVALGLLSVVPLLGADQARPVSPTRLWLAAAFFTAASFSKQNEVCILPVLLAFVGIRDGARQALRLAAAAAATSAIALLLCVASWGWSAVYLNLWFVPSRCPWVGGTHGIVQIASRFLEQLAGTAAVMLGLWFWTRRSLPRASTLRDRLLGSPWIVPAAAAALMFPLSVAGGVKVGGDNNSNHSLYYLAGAAALLAARLATSDRSAGRDGIPIVAALLVLVAVPALWFQVQPPTLEWRDSPLERITRFSKDHPGEVFLSSNPLVTLYTDGKLYHQGYGVFDRTVSGVPPGPRQIADHLPARMRWVATHTGASFWLPEGGTPIPAPPGLSTLSWFEHRGSPR